jgi:protein-disulfide isomerase
MNGDSIGRLSPPVGARDHIRGPAEAPVTIVEYGDYECAYCGEAYLVIEALRRALGERLRFVFRHFPLTEVHIHAQTAAEAAEAAAEQQKFWEMHDILYTHQSSLDGGHLASYGALLGLHAAQFKRALRDRHHESRVREDFHSGARSGVRGTPALFIDGIRYDGPRDLRSLLAVVSGATPNAEEMAVDAWQSFESRFRVEFLL